MNMIRGPAQAHPNTAQPLLQVQRHSRCGGSQHPQQSLQGSHRRPSSRAEGCGARAAAAQAQGPQQPQQPQDAANLGRRLLLAATAALAAAPLTASPPSAVAAPAAAPSSCSSSSETFMSVEGFAFDHPKDWVVAFDRSTTGSKSTGAVTVGVRSALCCAALVAGFCQGTLSS